MEGLSEVSHKPYRRWSRRGKLISIPMSSPDLTEAEIAAVTQVLQTPFLSIGPQLMAFEQAVASYVSARYVIGVNSGTSGSKH
jgi:perosamine synthetase